MPLTVRRALELMGLYFLGLILVVGQDVLAPILMAFFLSIMLLPVYRFLRARKLPESFAIALSLLLLILVVAGLLWFLSSQISQLVSDFPTIKQNVRTHLGSLSHWIETRFHYSTQKQTAFIDQQNDKLMNWVSGIAGGAASSITGIFVFVGLLPIYIFLIIFYKNLLLRFVFLWFKEPEHPKVEEALRESEVIIKSYLVGLAIQITYITILLGGILMLIGIKHAILIGIIFAFLNLIPYIGALVGNILGVLITLASSSELWPIVTVLAVIAFVQFLDNNILMPRIVGSKVKINALATIIGVIIAGSIAGVSGMFLSLPLIAVLKIVFDRTDSLRQWGVLLGDERPRQSPMRFAILRRKSKQVQEELQRENDVQPPKEGEGEQPPPAK
ncbi:MAG: AI-2E family transporter [Chitinophagaceae bacterium]|nr:MAG: AI-2E family transporter [Chitinophagaceae bacterium]